MIDTPGFAIVSFRIHSTNAGIQMPPIARSVTHDEAVALFDAWVDDVVDASYEDGANCAQ